MSYAEDKSDLEPSQGGNFSPAKCLAKGNLEFTTFLRASIFADGISGGIMEMWNDVLYRNKCQTSDIAGLINQRDKLRTYIRDAFTMCNTSSLPALKKAYKKLGAEIYYVRNITNKKVAINLPYDILSTRMLQNPDELFYPKSKLYSEMKSKYMDSEILPETEFDVLFESFETKYKTRRESYVICENSAWESVSKKWNEFLETVGGMAPAVKTVKKSMAQRAEKIVEAVTNKTLLDYISVHFAMDLNNLSAKEGYNQIVNRLLESLPVSGGGITQEKAANAIEQTDKAYDTVLLRQEMSSQFYVRYKEVSDSSVGIFVQSLTELVTTLSDSLSPLGKLLECTKTVNSRQCPATE
ncbi:hypothetical protein M0P48_03560 [Candidatus Gracilibacteria bacterium]|jgi:hypothetical protein|nr:hypothetical protein [Candidatus Gracilibacteria bacterium]